MADYGTQQVRSEAERDMPQWQRDHLDRMRQFRVQRRLENPELYEQLDRIESKLDALITGMSR